MERSSGSSDKPVWRLLDLEFQDPVHNLAIDETIMQEVGKEKVPDTIRFWRNPRITLIIGRFQIPELEVRQDAVDKYGAMIIRRLTGGGTVYNDQGNLNYSIAVRRDSPTVPNMIGEITPTLCKGVVEGLHVLGLNAEFESQGMYIKVNGRKVSGTASIIRRTVVFVHGTLLVNSDLAKLREILDVPPYPENRKLRPFVKSIRKEVTSIEAELGRNVSMSEVKSALKTGFAAALGIRLKTQEITEQELELCKALADARRKETVIHPD